MIIGTGIDLCDNRRIESLHSRYGERLTNKILHPEERPFFAASTRKIRFLSSKFAIKEAFVKAMGTGFRGGLWFTDIHIGQRHNQTPWLILSEKLNARLNVLFRRSGDELTYWISVSHETPMTMAQVIIESQRDIEL